MATSALAVTAAAVPVAVTPKAQAAEPDPIFAAIDEHKRRMDIIIRSQRLEDGVLQI
jgi:hypothetical protein